MRKRNYYQPALSSWSLVTLYWVKQRLPYVLLKELFCKNSIILLLKAMIGMLLIH